jgi:AraC-like DNA-binding protein
MPEPYFAHAYIRLLYRFMQLSGDSEARFLEGTGVAAAGLLAAGARLPFATQMRLCRNAIAISPPGLGLRIGAQLQLAAHGALGTAMQHAGSFAAALRTFAELVQVRASFVVLDVVPRPSHCELQLRFEGLPADVGMFFTESILSTLQHCGALHTGRRAPFEAIRLGYAAPPHARDYGDAFCTTIDFDAPVTTLHVTHAHLSMTTLDPDPQLHADSVRRCRLELEERSPPVDTMHAVHAMHAVDAVLAVEQLLWRNPGRLWRVQDIAGELSLGTRTLLRRLRARGTTFQAVRDGVLQQQAAAMLAAGSVAAAAASLGFADESSFRRTYRRWHGQSPRGTLNLNQSGNSP